MSDNAGRRPDGPGWYWYTGPGQWRARIDEPVWVSPPYVECRTRHRDEIVSDMPGDFVPLHPPVAAQPDPVAALDELRSKFGADLDGVDPDALVAEHRGQATWSQEPPDAPGWWWRWSELRGVELHLIEPELGGGELWNATDPEDDMMYPVHRTRSVPGLYWLPATVPQPPTGEVGT